MAVVFLATRTAAAIGGSATEYAAPSEDGPEVAAVFAAAQNIADDQYSSGTGHGTTSFTPKTDGSIVIGITGLPAGAPTSKLTTIWTPNPVTGNGRYDGLQWR